MFRHDYQINLSILQHTIGRNGYFSDYIPFVRITHREGVETM